jgi:hypothetical protein
MSLLNPNLTSGTNNQVPPSSSDLVGFNNNGVTQQTSQNNPLPVIDPVLVGAQSTDMPLSVSITGDSSGDFAGVNILEQVVTDNTGMALNTRSLNQPLVDTNNSLVLSDSPSAVTGTLGTNQYLVIDTKGYQTLHLTSGTLAATAGFQVSNDQVTWTANALSMNGVGAFTNAIVATTSYVLPVVSRYVRVVATTAGGYVYFLRNIAPTFLTQNLNAIGGAAVSATTGQLGVNLITSIATTNGQTLGTLVAPLTVAATVVKATAGRLYSISVGNAQTTAVYLKVYNAASVTLGTTSPIQNYLIPGGTTGGTFNVDINDYGLFFSTGICIAVTGGQALLDSTALTTAAVVNYSFI